MKKLILVVILAVASLIVVAGKISAKSADACPMCQVSCEKCDLAKAGLSASQGKDLKCCCGHCDATNKTSQECVSECAKHSKS